jgi:hypothetical protein
MEFLKKHYEKMVLCVVLLGLAGAVLWMKSALEQVKTSVTTGDVSGPPRRSAPPTNLDLSADQQSLAQVTNPPPLLLSGVHNLFNPVTWKRRSNGDLFKILKTGPDALVVLNIVPLYMIITFESADPPIYHLSIQSNVDLKMPKPPPAYRVRPRIGEKINSAPFVILGIKGAENDPTEINLEIKATGETNVWVSKSKPYQQVESYIADLKYDPDALTLLKQKAGNEIRLDNDPYNIVEITNDAVRVQARRTTKVTEIKWTNSP